MNKNIIMNGDFEFGSWNKLYILSSKPTTYHEKIKLKKIITDLPDEVLEKLRFPCHICLVNAACNKHCSDVYRYMNYIAGHISKMTADEICVYRYTVPNNVRKRIESLIRYNARIRIVKRPNVPRQATMAPNHCGRVRFLQGVPKNI